MGEEQLAEPPAMAPTFFYWKLNWRWLPSDALWTAFGHTLGHTPENATLCACGIVFEDPSSTSSVATHSTFASTRTQPLRRRARLRACE